MQSGPRSLLRTAPWTRAPLLAFREPAVALVIVGVAFVIGLTAAAGPLFDASTGSAALSLEMSQQCLTDLGPAAAGGGPLQSVARTNATLDGLSTRMLRAAGAQSDSLANPVVTLDAPVAVGKAGHGPPTAVAQLVTHTGGLEQISPIARVRGSGVWISGDLAQHLHIRPGGTMTLSADAGGPDAPARTVSVRVVGTYRALVGTVLAPFWCSLSSVFGTPDDDAPPPPVIMTTSALFLHLLHSAGAQSIDYYRWERPPSTGVDLQHAGATSTAITRFAHSVGDDVTRSGPQHRYAGGFRLFDPVAVQYGFLVDHALAVQSAVSQGIQPEIIAGIVVGLLLLASASIFWGYRRRTEVTLLLSRGTPAGYIGIKAALEAIPLMVIGAVLGWIGSVVLLSLIGPSSAFGSHALVRSVAAALVASLIALLLLAAMAAALSGRTRGHHAGRPAPSP